MPDFAFGPAWASGRCCGKPTGCTIRCKPMRHHRDKKHIYEPGYVGADRKQEATDHEAGMFEHGRGCSVCVMHAQGIEEVVNG